MGSSGQKRAETQMEAEAVIDGQERVRARQERVIMSRPASLRKDGKGFLVLVFFSQHRVATRSLPLLIGDFLSQVWPWLHNRGVH